MSRNFVNFKDGHFSGVAFIEPYSGKIGHRVLYRRRKIKSEEFNGGKQGRQACGLMSIGNDLKAILNWLKIVESIQKQHITLEHEADIMKSLFISIMTTHWKCFGDTKGRNRIRLNPKKYVKEEHIEIFEKMKELRHNFAAHAGEISYEKAILIKIKDTKQPKRFEDFIFPFTAQATNGDPRLVSSMSEYIKSVMSAVEAEQESIIKKLNTELQEGT